MLNLVYFTAASLALLLVPGPSVLYVVTRSVTQGRRGGLASVAGIETGGLTHAMAAAFGLSAILMTSALAFDIVKYVGAGYLVFLGLRVIFSRRSDNPTVREESIQKTPSRRLFFQGYLVELTNPKVALFFYAFLPQFVDPAQGGIIEQTLLLGLIFVALASCTDSMFALTSSTAGQLLARKAGPILRAQRYITGIVYVALGLAATTASSSSKS